MLFVQHRDTEIQRFSLLFLKDNKSSVTLCLCVFILLLLSFEGLLDILFAVLYAHFDTKLLMDMLGQMLG